MRGVQRKGKTSDHSEKKISMYSIQFADITFSEVTVSDVLAFLHEYRQGCLLSKDSRWLTYPLPLEQHLDGGVDYFYFEANRKLNRLIATKGTLLQQIEYLGLVGITDAIDRRPDLRNAANYHKFCETLCQNRIVNPSLAIHAEKQFNEPIRRIHAVHPLFLKDPEIRSGLYISQRKDTEHDKVLYVCSPETLKLAIEHCAPNATLIIDGHWLHDKIATHGVWEQVSAEQIAQALNELLTEYPGKISSIRLLGCEAGYLSDFETIPETFNPTTLIFKENRSAHFFQKEMAEFRNRAVYFSHHGESPFAECSLAGKIISQLPPSGIKVSACASRTYPFPADGQSIFNIGSDAKEWVGPHFWATPSAANPVWYTKLQRLKSITFIQQSAIAHQLAPQWAQTNP